MLCKIDLEATSSNLSTSTENLTAAESRIRDVDVAKEMVKLSKLNILNQASQAMVSQAKQQPEQCNSIIKIVLNFKLRGKAYALLFIFKFNNYKGELNMLLSIVMMVKNEEKYLDKTLYALKNLRKDIDSELIILDTGSTDNTVEIAKKYTEKVYFAKWNNNFADMRNISISYASGDWILILDADEKLTQL